MSAQTRVIMLPPQARPERQSTSRRRSSRLVKIDVQPDERLAVTVPEAARRIGIGRTLMYDLIASGAIETVHIGRAHRVRVDDLVAFLDREVHKRDRTEPDDRD